MSSLLPVRTWSRPRFDGSNVLTMIQLLNGMEPQGERILIMGAGVIGCETALYLASQGKKVTLCARQDSAELDTDIIDIHNREMLLEDAARRKKYHGAARHNSFTAGR